MVLAVTTGCTKTVVEKVPVNPVCSPKERPVGLPEIPKEAVDEAYHDDLNELLERLRNWGVKNERIILEVCDPA
jgi:hypothetical protein